MARTRSSAILLLLIAMISVQTGASLAKYLFPVIGANGATAFRLGFAAIIMCAISRPWRHILTWSQRRIILIYGIVLGVMNLSFYLALVRIPLGIAVAIEFTGPLTVALLSSHRPRDIAWAVLAAAGFIGIIPIGYSTTPLDPIGIGFALIAGVCWGLYIIFGQRAGASVPSSIASSLGMLIAACIAVPLSIWPGEPMTLTLKVLPLAIMVAILSSALPYSLEMIALQRLPTKTFGILMSLEPAIGAILGFLFLHEYLLITQWIGITCVILASIGSTVTSALPMAATTSANPTMS